MPHSFHDLAGMQIDVYDRAIFLISPRPRALRCLRNAVLYFTLAMLLKYYAIPDEDRSEL